jgi:uncharacterized coiled-coil DUF342 family protein
MSVSQQRSTAMAAHQRTRRRQTAAGTGARSRAAAAGKQPKKQTTMQRLRANMRRTQTLAKHSDEVVSTTHTLQRALHAVDEDMKKDDRGIADYTAELDALRRRKATLRSIIKENKAWADEYDRDIGPFEKRYAELRTSINDLYAIAKSKHAKGIQLLIDRFAYHPSFRRWNDAM